MKDPRRDYAIGLAEKGAESNRLPADFQSSICDHPALYHGALVCFEGPALGTPGPGKKEHNSQEEGG